MKAITLTPPSSLRLFKPNSTHHQQHQQQTQNSSQPQNNTNIPNGFNQQFTPEDSNDLFKTTTNNQNHKKVNSHGNNTENVVNRNGINYNQLQSSTTNFNGDTKFQNKFTPESDFVADFGKANIFVAPSSSTAHGTNNNHKNGLNGYNHNSIKTISNTSNGTGSANGENFADFEHNVIYNAAGKHYFLK